MNTNILLVTNIPRSFKQVELLKRLENKWARILFVDNPYNDLYDAFIYNPTSLQSHFEMGVNKLRQLVFNGTKPLKAYHIWFPPPNVYLTTKIPENSIMLPFLFVDNLHKDIETFEVIGELPFQAHEVKHWDIPQKEDKWMILRLPVNQDETIRDYVLKYIRSRRLSNGLFPRVLEVFVTEEPRLSVEMIPRSMKILPVTVTYKSNLLFVYDLSPKLTVKNIIDTSLSLNVRGVKTFFIDVVNSLKVGFLVVPKSLPDNRFNAFKQSLREKEIKIESLTTMLNIDEVWLQAKGALAPQISKVKEQENVDEFILTNYVFIHNVAACVDHNQLNKGSPINFKVYLFQVTENTTQIGFICLRGFSDDKIVQLVNHLRSLNFEGFQVMVDNIYLKCRNLPENYSERRAVHIPRNPIEEINEAPVNNMEEIIVVSEEDYAYEEIEDEEACQIASAVEIAPEPAEDYGLMKSDFIFIDNLADGVDFNKFSHLNIDRENINIMSSDDHKVAFLYYPDTNQEAWLKILEKVAVKKINNEEVEVSEVYLQSEETTDLLEREAEGMYPSKYVFVYNISDCNDTRKLEENDKIVRFSMMTPESGSCAFVELVSGLCPEEIIATLNYIRDISQRGSNLCGDLVWFAKVRVRNEDPNKLRSRWIKKSASNGSGGPSKKKSKTT